MEENKTTRIFISALEHSAERHCANLMRSVREKTTSGWAGADLSPRGTAPEAVQWVGFGGPQMAELGCSLLENTVARAAMIYTVFKQLGYYRKLIQQANEYFEAHRVDLVVVCDSPAFNFHIAKAAKRRGVPVLFYVAPQLWAWAPWRISKLRRNCDKLACILPFEKDWFRSRGVDTEFVSNPMFDDLKGDVQANYKSYLEYDPQSPKIALLPGSRDHEILSIWPAMLAVAAELKQQHPGATFSACGPDEEKRQMLEEIAADIGSGPVIEYSTNAVTELAVRSDFALVTSGSATLQVAAGGCPMAILYQSNRLLWHLLGRWLVRTRFLSLVNILAHQELVPEFMPYFSSIEPIIERSHNLLSSPSRMSHMSQSLINLVKPLTERRTSDVVAGIVLGMLPKQLAQ